MSRTKNIESFFSMLTNVEKIVIKKGYYVNESGDDVLYSPLCIETFNILVGVLASGKYAKSDAYTFIGSHFRLNNKGLTDLWNRVNKPKKLKVEATTRVQVSNASKVLYGIYGTNIYESFINDVTEDLLRIKKISNAILIGNQSFSELFVSEVCYLVEDTNSDMTFSCDELKETLYALKCTSKSNIEAIIKDLDKSKVSYISSVLQEPLFLDDKLNMKKADILVTYLETEIQNQSLVEEILPTVSISSESIETDDSVWDIEGLSFFDIIRDDIDDLVERFEGDDLCTEQEIGIALAVLRESCLRTYIANVNDNVNKFLSRGLKNPKVIYEILSLIKMDEDYYDNFVDYCCTSSSTEEGRKELSKMLGSLVADTKLSKEFKSRVI